MNVLLILNKKFELVTLVGLTVCIPADIKIALSVTHPATASCAHIYDFDTDKSLKGTEIFRVTLTLLLSTAQCEIMIYKTIKKCWKNHLLCSFHFHRHAEDRWGQLCPAWCPESCRDPGKQPQPTRRPCLLVWLGWAAVERPSPLLLWQRHK